VERNPALAAVVPVSGTILWSDLWVRPATAAHATAAQGAAGAATPSPTASSSSQAIALAEQWIEFCWKPEVAIKLSVLTAAASPIVALNRTGLPESLKTNALLLPDPKILRQSEFLLPLSAATVTQYQQVWQTLRQSGGVQSS
jgi:putative spermidine/putrescine transport system substrate-binding protein